MSAWKRRALVALPEYRSLIEPARGPMALWLELQSAFEVAWEKQDLPLVERILGYAAWCISEQSGPLPNDTSTAAACGFYEHLPEREDRWPWFPKWFSAETFAQLEPVFAYHLEAETMARLKAAFTGRPSPRRKRPR